MDSSSSSRAGWTPLAPVSQNVVRSFHPEVFVQTRQPGGAVDGTTPAALPTTLCSAWPPAFIDSCLSPGFVLPWVQQTYWEKGGARAGGLFPLPHG